MRGKLQAYAEYQALTFFQVEQIIQAKHIFFPLYFLYMDFMGFQMLHQGVPSSKISKQKIETAVALTVGIPANTNNCNKWLIFLTSLCMTLPHLKSKLAFLRKYFNFFRLRERKNHNIRKSISAWSICENVNVKIGNRTKSSRFLAFSPES